MISSQQTISGVSTVDAPAATVNGSNYVLAWTTSDESISWTTCPASGGQNSYDFVPALKVPNAASSGGPALANFKGTVWMAWKGESKDTRIFTSSLSGSTWSAGVPIAGVGTSSAPALTATDSALFLVWKGESDNTVLWSKSSDGKTWSPQAVVSGLLSSDTPALATFNGVVYMATRSASDNRISLSVFTNAKGWGAATVPSSSFETSLGPALGVGDTGNLHLVWKGASDTLMFESTLGTGKTAWTPQAKISTTETSARPALASQLSAATDIMLAFKGGATNDLLAAPLDNLAAIYPLPPGAQPLPTDSLLTWSAPSPMPPAPPNGPDAPESINFGSGPTQAAVAFSLLLAIDGTATFSGWYQDQGNLPLVQAPAQDYCAAMAVVASNGKVFTFSHTNNNGVATGGIVDTWNITQKSADIAQNWAFLEAKAGQTQPQAAAYGSCSNSTDFGSFLQTVVSDAEALVGDIETAFNVISVIAS